jgi:small multidrug resistance pump
LRYWAILAAAICFEVAGTTSMKLAEGFSRLTPSILIFVFYGISFVLLTLALKSLEVSVVYAVWSGMGTALVALIGLIWFKEPITAGKAVYLLLIIIGVVGLSLGRGQH